MQIAIITHILRPINIATPTSIKVHMAGQIKSCMLKQKTEALTRISHSVCY